MATRDVLQEAFNELCHAQEQMQDKAFGAFKAFEASHPLVAQALVVWIGDRKRASSWMMFHRHAFHGKSAFELLIDGDVEILWDYIIAATLPHHGEGEAGVDRQSPLVA